MSTPVPGGITADDLVEAATMIAGMAPIVSMDIAELTPPEDSGDVTVQAALKLAEAALSQSYRAESGGRLHPTAAA